MSYAPRTFAEIRDSMLAEWQNQVNGADISADSEIYLRASIFAGAVWGLHYGLEYVEDQIWPSSSDSDNLERHAATYEITRKAAEAATDGRITLTGTNGTVVSAGLSIAHADGVIFTTTTGGTIASGELEVEAAADEAGTAGNKASGTELTVQSPPAGVDAACEVTTSFTDGTDDETDAALLERVLARIRQGNAGGTANDYEQWALTINGVSFAYALPLRRGAGSVDVAVFGLADGHRTPAGSTVRAEVLAYLDTVRPVTADVQVPAITEVDVDVEVELTVLDEGLDVADVSAEVTAAIQDVIYAVEPGDTLRRVQLLRAIAAVDGVIDFEVTAPVANVSSTVSSSTVEALRPGTITVT